MRKLLAVLLSVLMICFAFGTVLAYYPGDTVSVGIYLHHTDAAMVTVYLSYDESVLELQSLTSSVQGSGSTNSGYLTAWTSDYSPLPTQIGTATFLIKSGAPAGTYYVSVDIDAILNSNEKPTSGSASAGSVTVEKKVCAEHTWDEGVVTTEPTCTTDGVKTFTCTECGEKKTESIPAAHDYQIDSVTAPTCEKGGYTKYVCSRCEGSYLGDYTDALGHDFGTEPYRVVKPTCTEKGYSNYQCNRDGCRAYENRNYVDALGHDIVVDKGYAATCTKDGLTDGEHCTRCDDATKPQEVIKAAGHTPETVPGKAATCTEDGLTEGKKCSVCSEILTAQTVIPATGHTPETLPGKDATCTEDGLTEGQKCSVCNDILTAQTVIPALDHAWNAGEITTPPTCEGKGVKTFTCTREGCGETRTEEIAANGHTKVAMPAVPATCTGTGLTEGIKCSVCQKVLTAQQTVPALGHDLDDGTVTTAPTCEGKGVRTYTCQRVNCGHTVTEDIPAKGHNPGSATVTKEPTCTETGLQSYKCTACGKSIKDEPIPALGHDLDSGVVTTPPTCEGKGVRTYTCQRKNCGHTETKEIPANGHTEETIPAVPATCTETGLTAGVKCSVCQKVLTAQQTVPALDHAWNAGEITTPAACLEDGVMTYTCTRTGCGETYTEKIPATGHTEATVPGKAATCTEDGLTDGKKCSVCGEITVKQTAIPAKGHSEVTVPGKAATCTKTGLTDGKKCSVCGVVTLKQETIPAKGHTEEIIPGKGATCTKTGLTEGKKCSVCGEITVKQETIPAKGHTEEIIPGKDATCTEDGLTDGKRCTVCGVTTVKQTTIPAKGHAWNGGVDITPATCTTDGEKLYTCTACSVTRTETVKAFGHTRGEWVVTRPVVNNTPGEKQRSCVTCGTLLETAVIPAAQYVHMTVSSIGPRFRDVCDVTDKWHMFTLIDLSQDGETLFDLVAGNSHLIGTMKVTVLEGQVTFTYELFSDEIKMTSEFLTIFPDLESVKTLDIEKLTAYAFNEPISIADQLSGDTSVLVYVLCECSYRDDVRGLKFFEEDNPVYLQQLELLKQTQQP